MFLFVSNVVCAYSNRMKSVLNKRRATNITKATDIIGEIKFYAGDPSHLPANWILCDGQPLSRTKYASLFSVIGESFGSGDGKNTFNLPDLRSRFAIGRDSLRVRSNVAVKLGDVGGHASHTLSHNHLPAHSHASGSLKIEANGLHRHKIRDPGHTHKFNYGHWNLAQGNRYIQVPNYEVNHSNDQMNRFIRRNRINMNVKPGGFHSHELRGNTSNVGGGESFPLLNPYQIMNYIIFTGINHANKKQLK